MHHYEHNDAIRTIDTLSQRTTRGNIAGKKYVHPKERLYRPPILQRRALRAVDTNSSSASPVVELPAATSAGSQVVPPTAPAPRVPALRRASSVPALGATPRPVFTPSGLPLASSDGLRRRVVRLHCPV